MLRFNLKTAGKYSPANHLFPGTLGLFSLTNGSIQTSYYPHPIEQINVGVNCSDKSGDLHSLQVQVSPAGFYFEGKPFQFKGDFKNFDDLNYDVSLKGELDLGKIYKVFAVKDVDINGFIRADATFKGKQSDATNRRFSLLRNAGTMDFKELSVSYELFPKPFIIHRGHFRFDQDKMWFETFQADYGHSDFQLKGYVTNVINYVLAKNATLQATFSLKSANIDLNEFAVNASSSSSKATADTSRQTGVIMIPPDLDLSINAEAVKVLYTDVTMNQFAGGVKIRQAGIELTETGFELIGCKVVMSGKYNTISASRAAFDYHLKATDFDVQRAYKEIKLFHDLASSAANASGFVSIDYSLSGKLNEKMYPIYPSLAGGGRLSVKQLKFKNWKLFNTVSSQSGKSELTDPDLSKIDVKSTIKNNIINIEKMKFKTSGFRIRFEGKTSFENKINFKMRIGLPPLGIIGIPLRITGTSDNPKIRMGSSDSDPLGEKEDDSGQ